MYDVLFVLFYSCVNLYDIVFIYFSDLKTTETSEPIGQNENDLREGPLRQLNVSTVCFNADS